jgi:hypothetical protein
MVTRDPRIRILLKRTQAILRTRPTINDTTEVAIGARAVGRTAVGVERTGVVAIGATLGEVTGMIGEGQTRAAADLAVAGALAPGRARAAVVQAGTVEPTIAGSDHTAVTGSRRRTPPT